METSTYSQYALDNKTLFEIFNYGVYVIKCENDKYYVGYSTKLFERINQHFMGEGSKWTQLHKPIRVVFVRELGIDEIPTVIERQVTNEYIKKYGEYNVRGAGFTQRHPSCKQLKYQCFLAKKYHKCECNKK
ncbi:MAG: GIY-YIG nuclease family protein [Methanobacterium sp.]